MSEVNNTTKGSKNQYHHLKPDDRAKIQSLIETGSVYSVIHILQITLVYTNLLFLENLERELNLKFF